MTDALIAQLARAVGAALIEFADGLDGSSSYLITEAGDRLDTEASAPIVLED